MLNHHKSSSPIQLSYFAILYVFTILFVLLTEEQHAHLSEFTQIARNLLWWRVASLILLLVGHKLLNTLSCSRRTLHAASELSRQSRTGLFPSWERRVGPPLGDHVFNQEQGEHLGIDSEPHILMTVRWWDEQCQQLVQKACLAGVHVIVLVPSIDIAKQIQAGNIQLAEDNVLGNSAGLYIVVDDGHQNIRQEYDQDALRYARRSPCYCLCLSYLVRGIFNKDFDSIGSSSSSGGRGSGNGVYVLDRDGRICSVGQPGDSTDMLRCVGEAKEACAHALASCSSCSSSSSSSSSSPIVSTRTNVPDEIIYVHHLRASYMSDRRMQGISLIERRCGLYVPILLMVFLVLHACTSFVGFYMFYIFDRRTLVHNMTAVQDHGLWLAATADTWLGMLLGVVPVVLLAAAVLLALLFWTVLLCVRCICTCILSWTSPCEEAWSRGSSHGSSRGSSKKISKVERDSGSEKDNTPLSEVEDVNVGGQQEPPMVMAPPSTPPPPNGVAALRGLFSPTTASIQ